MSTSVPKWPSRRSKKGSKNEPLKGPYFRHMFEKDAVFQNLYLQGTGSALETIAFRSVCKKFGGASLQSDPGNDRDERATPETTKQRNKDKRLAPRRSGGWSRPRRRSAQAPPARWRERRARERERERKAGRRRTRYKRERERERG